MPAIVISLVSALVPLLVQEAERLLAPSQSQDKRQWVHDAVSEALGLLQSRIPDWLKPEESQLVALIDDAIDKALDKIGA